MNKAQPICVICKHSNDTLTECSVFKSAIPLRIIDGNLHFEKIGSEVEDAVFEIDSDKAAKLNLKLSDFTG